MSGDQIFGAVALLALLVWLISGRLSPEKRELAFRIAMVLIGGGILVALFMFFAGY